jgi:hypothetical protein
MWPALRRAVGTALGAVVVRLPWLRPYRERLLSTWQTPDRRRPLDRLLFGPVFSYWLEHVYWPERDPDRREQLKELCMGGTSGVQWADHYDAQPVDLDATVGTLTWAEAWPVYPRLLEVLEGFGGRATVIQIGASSGREIAWIAGRFGDATCVGTDPYPAVVERAAQLHQAPNLRFSVAAAHELGDLLADGERPVVVFDSGSLQYVQPEHVAVLMRDLGRTGAQLLAANPSSTEGDSPLQLGGTTPLGSFSYAHDYRHYAAEAGLGIVEARLVRPYPADDPVRRHTAHYFLHAAAR